LGRCEIPPRERAFLAVGLAERDREACPRELPAQIKGVRRLAYVEFGEEVAEPREIGAADEALVVQYRNSVSVREDPEVGVGEARLQRAQILFAESQRSRILDGDDA